MLQKKIIWKLNIIDLLLIAIILLSVSALIYKSVSGSGDESEYREYKITYICESAPIKLLDSVTEGALCVDGNNGDEVGELTDFEVTPIAEYDASAARVSDRSSSEESRDNDSENTDEDNTDGENGDENSPESNSEDENMRDENSDADSDSDEESSQSKKATPTPGPTPTPTRGEAVFNTVVEAAKADHGIRIEKNVYLLGQNVQLVIGDAVFDVYISDIE